MAAFDFPNSPSVNDTYSANGMTFTWNGTKWERTSPSVGAQGATGSGGSTGAQGAAGSATISSNADNRVITGGSGTNLVGESTLTYNGSGTLEISDNGSAYILTGPGVTKHEIAASASDNDLVIQNNKGAGNITSNVIFKGSGSGGATVSEKMRITTYGVGINHDTSGASGNAALTIKNRTSSTATKFNLVNTGSSSVESTQIYSQNNDLAFVAGATTRIRINQYGGLKLFNASSNISGTDTGALYYNTADKRLKVYNGNDWTNTDIASDPYWSYVVLLIQGASTITDSSGRHTLSLNGNAQTSTTHTSPVGNSHTIRLCSGSSGDYLDVQSNLGDFRLDDSDWTF